MHFHFDRDEHVWEDEGVMKHPFLSSILYISEAGGPTLVVDQRCDERHQQLIPAEPMGGTIFEVEANSWATFDGRLLHGVCNHAQSQRRVPDLELDELDENSETRRITLLVNFWEKEIKDAGSMSAKLGREEAWAYGSPLASKLWESAHKRARTSPPYSLDADDVRKLYTYDLTGDQDTSAESGNEKEEEESED